MKIRIYLWVLFLIAVLQNVNAQATAYDKIIAEGDAYLKSARYLEAIDKYFSARVRDDSKSAEVEEKIKKVFLAIDKVKVAAVTNEKSAKDALIKTKRANDSLTAQKLISDSLQRLALANFKDANTQRQIAESNLAKVILADANRIMFEAEDVAKFDPSLALHLADTAIQIVRNNAKNASKDSAIFDRFNRLYYENNFGTSLFRKFKDADSLGAITSAIYAPNDHFIWTITDSAFALLRDTDGELKKKIKLDKTYDHYVFKVSADSQILVHGFTSPSQGTLWDISGGKSIALNDTFQAIYSQPDAISLNPLRDKSEGWAKRLFVFGYKAYQRKKDGSMLPVINGAGSNISVVAFSPDGKLIATNWGPGRKGITIRDANGKILDSSINNTTNIPAGMEFSPDGKMLVVRQANFLQLYKIKILKEPAGAEYHLDPNPQELRFSSYTLQTFKISSDDKSILVSCKSGSQQTILLYRYNDDRFRYNLFSQFKCPGSAQTSAVFSKDESWILSSSDKVRLWKIPARQSESLTLNTKSEAVSAIDHDQEKNLYNVFTYKNNVLKFDDSLILKGYDSLGTAGQIESARLRLIAFLPTDWVYVISEDGKLKVYNEKVPPKAFPNDFRFDEFTTEQRKKYGLFKNE